MSTNPWGVSLKKTGLREQRSIQDEMTRQELENRQSELEMNAALNKENKDIYDERQGSLAASALMGKQGILGRGGKKKSRRHRKHKSLKTKKTRRHRRHYK
jgi:ParB-like chromosome segregation protein Spo0J